MIRKRRLWLFWATTVLAIGIFLIWPRTRHGHYPTDVHKWLFDSKEKLADLMMENIEYTNNRDGRDEWVLNASLARYTKEDKKVHLDTVRTKFFLKSGKTVIVSGENATYDTKSKEINLWRNVSAVTSDEEHFYTSAITYNEEKRLLSTLEDVIIVGSKMDLKGKGLTYELATGNMSIPGNVRVVTQKKLR